MSDDTLTQGIRCRFLVELRDGDLVQCKRTTPNQHTELCIEHIAKVLRSVRESTGALAPRVFLETLNV